MDIPEFLRDAPDSVFTAFDRDTIETLAEKKQAGHGDETVAPDTFARDIEAFLDEELDHKSLIRDQHIDAAQLDEYMFQLIRGVRM